MEFFLLLDPTPEDAFLSFFISCMKKLLELYLNFDSYLLSGPLISEYSQIISIVSFFVH